MLNPILSVALLAAGAVAAPVVERQTTCSSYTIINTRGTGEAQGESGAFTTINRNVLSQLSGGRVYSTVYPAGADQQSSAGTDDIVNQVQQTLARDANECIILEGYSQGAAATVNAMPRLTGASFNAIKGVFFVGNPTHKAGLACNVDTTGGTSTKDSNGVSVSMASIPDSWVSKTLDVCNYGDGICDTAHGFGINQQHLAYLNDANTQDLGTKFVLQQLRSGGATSGTGTSTGGSTTTPPASTPTPTTGSTSGFGGFTFPSFSLPGSGSGSPFSGLSGFSFPSFGRGFSLPGSS